LVSASLLQRKIESRSLSIRPISFDDDFISEEQPRIFEDYYEYEFLITDNAVLLKDEKISDETGVFDGSINDLSDENEKINDQIQTKNPILFPTIKTSSLKELTSKTSVTTTSTKSSTTTTTSRTTTTTSTTKNTSTTTATSAPTTTKIITTTEITTSTTETKAASTAPTRIFFTTGNVTAATIGTTTKMPKDNLLDGTSRFALKERVYYTTVKYDTDSSESFTRKKGNKFRTTKTTAETTKAITETKPSDTATSIDLCFVLIYLFKISILNN